MRTGCCISVLDRHSDRLSDESCETPSHRLNQTLLRSTAVASRSCPTSSFTDSVPDSMRLLIAEGDPYLRDVLVRGLLDLAYAVDATGNGAEALTMAVVHDFDALVLDILLPEKDGLTICRGLRARGVMVPILLLTSRDAVDDRIGGLDAGADSRRWPCSWWNWSAGTTSSSWMRGVPSSSSWMSKWERCPRRPRPSRAHWAKCISRGHVSSSSPAPLVRCRPRQRTGASRLAAKPTLTLRASSSTRS